MKIKHILPRLPSEEMTPSLLNRESQSLLRNKDPRGDVTDVFQKERFTCVSKKEWLQHPCLCTERKPQHRGTLAWGVL